MALVQATRTINTWYGIKLLKGSITQLINPLLAPIVCSACMFISVYFLKESEALKPDSNILQLLQMLMLGAVTCIASMFCMFKKDLNNVYEYLISNRGIK